MTVTLPAPIAEPPIVKLPIALLIAADWLPVAEIAPDCRPLSPILKVPPVPLTARSWISAVVPVTPFCTCTMVATGLVAIATGVPMPRLSSNENSKVSSFVVESKFAVSGEPSPSAVVRSFSSVWMLSKLMSLTSNLPSPFASGCDESPLLNSGSMNLCLNAVA